MNTTHWIITDKFIITLLLHDGFIVEPGADKPWDVWYSTNMPIAFNKSYVLSNGLTIYSSGTSLHLAGQKPLHQMTKEELARVQADWNGE